MKNVSTLFAARHIARYTPKMEEEACIEMAINKYLARKMQGQLESGNISTLLFIKSKYEERMDAEIGQAAQVNVQPRIAQTAGQYIRKAISVSLNMARGEYTIKIVSRPTGLRFDTDGSYRCNHYVGLDTSASTCTVKPEIIRAVARANKVFSDSSSESQ
jgi:hypothetical protein